MQRKNFASVILIMVMTALTLTPVSCYQSEDILLPLVSGSQCDQTTFEYRGHTIAEGFSVSISADLPQESITQIKFGGAVAGLGESWREWGLFYHHEFQPYVKEMWVRVEGDSHYTAVHDTIYDNTGTGGPSWEFFSKVLEGIGIIFTVYEIYDWLAEVRQTPPVAEWDENGHWTKAISRQGGWIDLPPTYVPYLPVSEPRLQTASANIWGYFEEEGLQTLTVTAGAEIYVQFEDLLWGGVVQTYIGTYSVSFEVELLIGLSTLEIYARSGGSTDPSAGSHTYDIDQSVLVTAQPNNGYYFSYWTLDLTEIIWDNPITVVMSRYHRTLVPHFVQSGGGGGGGCVAEGTLVTMADWSTKPVEKIKKGDQVLGYDPTTGSYMAENVLDTMKHQVEAIVNINNGMLKLTPLDQPIFIRNSTYEGWMRDPTDIQVGWEIYEAKTNGWVPVTSVTYEEGKTRVYDMVLDGYTTYLANSILLMDKGTKK